MPFRKIVALATALALVGCTTHLQTLQERTGRYVPASGLEVGADYGLPMLQFDMQVSRTLVQCRDDRAEPLIRFLTKVELQPTYVTGEKFALDYEAMSGWSKTSAFEIQTYDSGVIKSINAETVDQTKGIAGNVVKSGISLLSLVNGVPLGTNLSQAPPGGKPIGTACSAATVALLALITKTTKALSLETSKLVGLNDEVSRLERAAGMGALTKKMKNSLEKNQKAVEAQAQTVANLAKESDALVARVSVSERVVWPQTSVERVLNASPNAVNKAKLAKLFEQLPGGYTNNKWEATLSLRGRLVPVVAQAVPATCDADTDKECTRRKVKAADAQGVIYRSPVAGRMLICETAADEECDLIASTGNITGASGVIVSAPVAVPQLGALRVLPYRNGAFQNNVLKVAFRENGSIAMLNYDEKAARGLALSETVSSGLGEVTSYRDARQAYRDKQAADAKAEDESRKKAVLDELDTEISRLEKVKKINALNAQTSQTASTADMETETARLNAQLALLEAQRKVRDAQAVLSEPVSP
ncbi:hypothetical protein HX792_13870 [Pseudomonas sp. B6002]|uniref:hypothetical protein n=1 Tax=Pseudomonas sp. B6002 TaxID=2726978 RepID=UPI0015A0FBE2|nr:hypothetical protein [Pseudomonas sp. B6002]NVZ51427.1 hypothetical protein [Pseudomonas sp. B6002]